MLLNYFSTTMISLPFAGLRDDHRAQYHPGEADVDPTGCRSAVRVYSGSGTYTGSWA